MKTIDEDIKSEQLKNVYLLFGDERYLLLQYRDKLVNAITTYEDTMNFTRFEGEATSETEIIDLAETLPFFSEKRCILIENSSFFSDSPDSLVEYMSQLPDTTYLIFCEKSLKKNNRLYKAIAKNGRAIEFNRLDDKTLHSWLRQKLRAENKEMDAETLDAFLNAAGDDMAYISMEFEKVISYVGDRSTITKEDIDTICSVQITDKVFDMIEAVSAHNEKKAFQLYYDLLALKVAPIKILVLIARHYRILLTVKTMSAQGASRNEIASYAGIRDFLVRNYSMQANGYSSSQLKDILKDIADYDYAIKSGNLVDQLALESFILKYSKA